MTPENVNLFMNRETRRRGDSAHLFRVRRTQHFFQMVGFRAGAVRKFYYLIEALNGALHRLELDFTSIFITHGSQQLINWRSPSENAFNHAESNSRCT
jgi:hypothetical protein